MTTFLLSVMLAIAAPVPKEDQQRFEKAVSTAREKAIDFLKKQQNKEGNWEGTVLPFLPGLDGGTTAIATLGLLEAGVKPHDAAITKAVDYLVKLKPTNTYVASLQIQVLSRVDAKKHARQIQTNVDWLLGSGLGLKNGKLEGWSYPGNDLADNSNTHFAVMGLHAAAQAGAKIDGKLWEQIREYYTRTQRKAGWSYYNQPDEFTSSSMSACGVLGLTLGAKYDKNAKKPDANFDKGMAAYLAIMEFESPKSTFYNLMVIAELGRVLGVTEFKSDKKARAWYREGAEFALKLQKEDGSFTTGTSLVDGEKPISTAFALYFLGPPPAKK